MTRFARAKGSKSSNERKPEEATSWSELKSAMLLKNVKKTEMVKPQQKKKDVKVENIQGNVKWACLEEDELGKSISLIKQHLGKKRKINDLLNPEDIVNEGKTEKKQKTKESDPKKKKIKVIENESIKREIIEKKLKKKYETGKKRNFDETGGFVPTKKMKKAVEKGTINSEHPEEMEDGKKFKKKVMKFNKFEKEKNGNVEFKNKNWKNFDKLNKRFNKKQKSKGQDSSVSEIIVNGEKIPIVKFQGFNVTLEDAERLKKLRNEMIKEGIPKSKVETAIKLERRRAEKALSRLKKAVCFLCRGYGHFLSNCPNLKEKEDTCTGICYKCGSTEHTAMECKVVKETNFQFAECFICKEQGHIARQCPDNPRGLYPNGGACRECGDVTHLRKDCPKVLSEKAEKEITVGIRDDRDLECLDEEIVNAQRKKKKKVNKNVTIKF